MAVKSLSADDLVFGREVLQATDELGMAAEGAFWLHDNGSDSWTYFLVTSLFAAKGPRWIYLRLNQALSKKLAARKDRYFDICICGPREALARHVQKAIKTPYDSLEPFSGKIELNGDSVDVVVYRIAPAKSAGDAERNSRKFDREVKKLLAA